MSFGSILKTSAPEPALKDRVCGAHWINLIPEWTLAWTLDFIAREAKAALATQEAEAQACPPAP